MKIRNFNIYLVLINLIGIIVSIIWGILNDKGGAGFGYIIIGFTFTGGLSFLFILYGIKKLKNKLIQTISSMLIILFVLILNFLEVLMLNQLSLF